MNDPIIDRIDAVQLFMELIDPISPQRFLRLLGEAKMGKSHLLTRIFPRIAAEQGFDCVVLDLRNRQITIVEHLHQIRNNLGRDRFVRFDAAYSEWINRPQIQVEGFQAVLSLISIRSRSDEADAQRMNPQFTKCFVDDLLEHNAKPLVLIFDAVEQASDETQEWLMDKLLVQLHPLNHVHVIVGGRNIPEPSGSYHPICCSYELRAVTDHTSYIQYCHDLGLDLEDSVITALAHAFEYVPGNFANVLDRRFRAGGVGHD